jgi:hypothetical protein
MVRLLLEDVTLLKADEVVGEMRFVAEPCIRFVCHGPNPPINCGRIRQWSTRSIGFWNTILIQRSPRSLTLAVSDRA